MEKINSYDEYSVILSDFKTAHGKCSTNKLMLREELSDLIEAGRFFYGEIDGVLWFFVNDGYFYSANFYVPVNVPIRMQKQEMDVVVDLTGNDNRYNQQWEDELIATGFQKRDKRLEFDCQLDRVVEEMTQKNKIMHRFWERNGFTYRYGVKVDYPKLLKLWEDVLGRQRYSVTPLTETELDEMEKNDRCSVICDREGKISAAFLYLRKNRTAFGFLIATYYKGSGLGAAAYTQTLLHAYQEGCVKFTSWVREDNMEALNIVKYAQKPTGKYYWQFVFRSDNSLIKI